MKRILGIILLILTINISTVSAYQYGDGKYIDNRTKKNTDVAISKLSTDQIVSMYTKVSASLKKEKISKNNRRLLEYISYVLKNKAGDRGISLTSNKKNTPKNKVATGDTISSPTVVSSTTIPNKTEANIQEVPQQGFSYSSIKTIDDLKKYTKEYIEIEPSLKYTDSTGNTYSVGFSGGYVNIPDSNNINWDSFWTKNIPLSQNVLLMTKQNGRNTYMLTVGGYSKTLITTGGLATGSQSPTNNTNTTTNTSSQTNNTTSIISFGELKTKANKNIVLHGVGGTLGSTTFPSDIKWIYRDATDVSFGNGVGIKDNPTISISDISASGIDINSPFYLFEAVTDGVDFGTNKSWKNRMIGVINTSNAVDLNIVKNNAKIYVTDNRLQSSTSFTTSNQDIEKLQDTFLEKAFGGSTWKNSLITVQKTDGTNLKNGALNLGENVVFEVQSTNKSDVVSDMPILVGKRFGDKIQDSLVLEQTGQYGNIYYHRFYVTSKFIINTQAAKTIADINALGNEFDRVKASFSKTAYGQDPLHYYQDFIDENGNLDTKKVEAYKSLKILVDRLTSGATNDDKKIENIFNWIVDNIKYNEEADHLLSTAKTEEEYNDGIKNISNKNVWSGIYTYINKNGVCAGYANLFSIMLSIAGIDDQEVKSGMVKKSVDTPVWKSSHAWNRVGSYYYDPTWGKKWYKLSKDVMYQNRTDFPNTK